MAYLVTRAGGASGAGAGGLSTAEGSFTTPEPSGVTGNTLLIDLLPVSTMRKDKMVVPRRILSPSLRFLSTVKASLTHTPNGKILEFCFSS